MTPYSLMQRITIALALSRPSRSMGATDAPVRRRPRRARWWLPAALAFALCLGACAHAGPAAASESGAEHPQTPDLTPDLTPDKVAGAGAQPR